MKYKIETTYNLDTFIAYIKMWEKSKTPLRFLYKFYSFFSWIVGLFCIATGLLMVYGAIFGNHYGLTVTLMGLMWAVTVIAIGLFSTPLVSRNFIARRSWKLYQNRGDLIVYTFFDYYFTEDTPTSQSKYDYATIKKIACDNDYFYLFTHANMAHILKKSDFKEGNADTFLDFLQSSTRLSPIK